jgi:membrane-associated phospholipid phosphatase
MILTFVLVSSFTASVRAEPKRTAFSDPVIVWNNAALNAIRGAHMSPPEASRALAILHAAIYDAVNGITRSYAPYVIKSGAPSGASKEAAASAAAYYALSALFPSTQVSLDMLNANILSDVSDGPEKTSGMQWGKSVATEILGWRANDGSAYSLAPPESSSPAAWQLTPPFKKYLLPQWGFVRPFAMTSSSQFRPPGPPALGSAKWAADYDEVKKLGAAVHSTRTAEQELIAQFWADGTGTETPPGHWNSIAQAIAAAQGNTLEENARLFALLNIAMADAAISAWDAKYTYDFWRPVTAIRNGDADDNPKTPADPAWNSYLTTPPFPDYISGHSTFSAAAAKILALFYGSDDIPFTTRSDSVPGATRSFPSFSAAAAEAAASRVYGGIHFRSASNDGLIAGARIGEWTFTHYMRTKSPHSRD